MAGAILELALERAAMGIPRALLVPVASARASLISAALAQQRFDAVNATDVDAQAFAIASEHFGVPVKPDAAVVVYFAWPRSRRS